MQDNNSILRQYGAKYGLFLGAALLIISIVSVYFVAYVDVSPIVFLLSRFFSAVILKLILAIAAVLALRRAIGGYWNLKQATTGIFFMFYMSFLINYIGYEMVFAHAVAPTTIQQAGERTIDVYLKAQQSFKTSKTDTEKTVQEMRDSLKKGYAITPLGVLSNLVTWVLIIFLIALVFAALFKREPPVFTQSVYNE